MTIPNKIFIFQVKRKQTCLFCVRTQTFLSTFGAVTSWGRGFWRATHYSIEQAATCKVQKCDKKYTAQSQTTHHDRHQKKKSVYQTFFKERPLSCSRHYIMRWEGNFLFNANLRVKATVTLHPVITRVVACAEFQDKKIRSAWLRNDRAWSLANTHTEEAEIFRQIIETLQGMRLVFLTATQFLIQLYNQVLGWFDRKVFGWQVQALLSFFQGLLVQNREGLIFFVSSVSHT